jgi:hypothetical protein
MDKYSLLKKFSVLDWFILITAVLLVTITAIYVITKEDSSDILSSDELHYIEFTVGTKLLENINIGDETYLFGKKSGTIVSADINPTNGLLVIGAKLNINKNQLGDLYYGNTLVKINKWFEINTMNVNLNGFIVAIDNTSIKQPESHYVELLVNPEYIPLNALKVGDKIYFYKKKSGTIVSINVNPKNGFLSIGAKLDLNKNYFGDFYYGNKLVKLNNWIRVITKKFIFDGKIIALEQPSFKFVRKLVTIKAKEEGLLHVLDEEVFNKIKVGDVYHDILGKEITKITAKNIDSNGDFIIKAEILASYHDGKLFFDRTEIKIGNWINIQTDNALVRGQIIDIKDV